MNALHLTPLLLAAAFSHAIASPPLYDVATLGKETLSIDGKLDEAAWQQAQEAGDFQWMKAVTGEGTPAQTSFRLMADEDYLYVGIRSQEPLMARLADQAIHRNGPFWERDSVELFLDPTGKDDDFYHFAVTVNNDQFSAYMIEGGQNRGGHYDPVWESAVFRGSDFWSVEMRIPLSALSYTLSSRFSEQWRINLARERFPKQELTNWAPTHSAFNEQEKWGIAKTAARKSPRYDLRFSSPIVDKVEIDGDGATSAIQFQVTAGQEATGSYQINLTTEEGALIGKSEVKVGVGENLVRIDPARFPQRGKAPLRLTVLKGQEKVADSYTAANVVAEPISIHLSSPSYGDAIFPGQTISSIAGRVETTLSPSTLKGAEAEIIFQKQGNSPANQPETLTKKLTRLTTDRHESFSFDVQELEVGDYEVCCRITMKGETLAEFSRALRKLPPAPANSLYLDEHQRLILNGKPIFARGWYGDQTFLVSRELLRKHPVSNSRHLNLFGGVISFEAERLDPEERAVNVRNDVRPSEKVFAEMKRLIDENRGKEFFIYYLNDEPECRGVSPVYLRHQYEFIKENDPYHPVVIISREPGRYKDCADIISAHPYISPVVDSKGERRLKNSPKNIRSNIREVLTASQGKVPAWYTAQAFSYGEAFGTVSGADFPTFDEYRCSVWTAIANGATGLYPFIYSGHFSSPDLRVACEFEFESIEHLEPYLLSPSPLLSIAKKGGEDAIDTWAKVVDGVLVFVAVNLQPEPVKASFSAPQLKEFQTLHGFRQEGETPVRQGEFELTFEPYRVHILTSKPLGAGLTTVEKAKEEIASIRQSLKKEGNILYGRGTEIEWNASNAYLPSKGLHSLTDGLCDTYGWADWGGSSPGNPPRVEMAFPKFVPEFSKAKFYSATVEELEVWIWKFGEWIKAGETRENRDGVLEIALEEPVRTVRIKVLMNKVKPGEVAELYEIELYP